VNRVALHNRLVAFFVLVSLLVTGASFLRLGRVSIDHLQAPHDLYFESHNLATIESIRQNAPIYSPSFYAHLPFIITTYNPLYHYLVAALPAKSDNPFFTGRLVSLISLILSALLFLKVGECRKNLLAPILFMGWIFLLPVNVQNGAYLRVDTLALLFSLLAIALLEGGEGEYLRICLAAVLGFLAFTVKQSSISATCACFLFLCCQNRKGATLFAVLTSCLYGGFALFAQIVWGSGYWFSAYLSLLGHPVLLNNILDMWEAMLREPLFTLLVLVTALSAFEALRFDGVAVFRKSPFLLYLIVTTLVLLFTVGKVGSDRNHFMEFIFACSFWVLFFNKKYWTGLRSKWVAILPIFVFCAVSVFELYWGDSHRYSRTDPELTRYLQGVYRLAAKELDELGVDKGNLLTLNTHVLLYTVQRRAYLNDPFNYWLMWSTGVLDISPLVDAIEKRKFSAILVVSSENPYWIPALTFFPESPATNRVFRTLDKFYVLRKRGVFLYFLPRAELVQK
jgi:hypothetical protein